MDRRTLFALLAALLLMQLWLWWRTPPPVPVDTDTDVAAATTGEPEVATAGTSAAVATSGTPAGPAPGADLPIVDVPLHYCAIDAKLTTDGGYLRDVALTEYKADLHALPIYSWVWDQVSSRIYGGEAPPGWRPYTPEEGPARIVSADGELLGMGTGALDTASPRTEVVSQGPGSVVLRGQTADGVEVTRTITADEDCVLTIDATWRNVGASPYGGDLWLTFQDAMGGTVTRYNNLPRPAASVGGSLTSWDKLEKLTAPEKQTGAVDWFGIASHYFAAVMLPDPSDKGELWIGPRPANGATVYGGQWVVSHAPLPPGGEITERFRMYVGTKDLNRLKSVDPRLGDAVSLGWFGLFARMLMWLLGQIQSFVGNWGVAIIILTLLVKLALFPLTAASFKSSQAMQALQPKMQAIREEFKDNQEELNRRTMELFREHGVNPVGGCLPMFLQMPLFFALYWALQSSVSLYQAQFLYLKDLSSPDPYMVGPAIVLGLMILQQQMMPTAPNMDPAQQQMMKIMPMVFGLFFFAFPSGLVVYYVVNMALSILQQWYIRRTYTAAART